MYIIGTSCKIRLMPDWIIFVLIQLYNQICNTFALYFFCFAQQSFAFPREGHDFFSPFYLSWSRCSLSPRRVSSKQESSRFRNQVVPPIRLYPVCIRNSFLDARWEVVLYFLPILDFLFVLSLTRSIRELIN